MTEHGWPIYFCAACGTETPRDSYGCRTCRHRAAERSDAISSRNQRIALFVMLGLAVVVPLTIFIVGKISDGIEPEPTSEQAAPAAPAPPPSPPVGTPVVAPPLPPIIDARTPNARPVAEAVIAWCGYNGNAAFWRGDFSVEAIDVGKGRFNVIVDHKRKGELLNGHTLWYLAKTKRGKLHSVTPKKQISADLCRGLSSPGLENDVEAIVD